MQNIIFIIVLISLLYYLIGSVPVAYLVIRFFHDKDITMEGSGNVGAMNSYDVSGSKKIGILVFILDFIKGLLPALLPLYFLGISLETIFIPLVALVVGHNFSVWLKFKGGRGLATALGIFAVINVWIVILWGAFYLIAFLFKKNVHIDNSIATILTPFVFIILNLKFQNFVNYNLLPADIENILCVLICVTILLKHISPIISLIKTDKT